MTTQQTSSNTPQADATARLRKQRWVAWTLVVAWAAFIFFMSAHTGNDLDYGSGLTAQLKRWLSSVALAVTGTQVDVSPVGHFCEYFVFGVLLTLAFCLHVSDWRAAASALGVTALYAVTDEIHQIFVPGRACDPADWVVDVVACAVAALITVAVVRAFRKRKGNSPLA